MRQSFDKKVPVIEQRMRVAGAKQVGRKHNHVRSHDKERTLEEGKRRAAHRRMTFAKFKAKVRAYWRGEREEYPDE